MAFLTQSMNQFAQTPILGLVDLIPAPNVFNAQINPSSSATAIQVGSAVKLLAGATTASTILVDVCTGPTDGPVYGIIPYNNRKNVYNPGDLCEVAAGSSVLFLKSSAAISRGDKVTTTAATTTADPTVATVATPTTQYVTGVALDVATAANQLIRVEIKPSFNSGV